MKKILITTITVFITTITFSQSTEFGVTAGVHSLRFSESGFSTNSTGFYLGGFTNIEISDKLDFHPELHYANVEDTSLLIVPILVKYNIIEQFNLQAGPQIDYFLEDSGDYIDSFGASLALGAGFDITDDLIIQARYSIGITNRFEGALKVGSFQAGIGYKFN